MEKRLYRNEYRKKLAGVCAGLSEYMGIDVAFVRLFFVLACILHGGGLLIYIVLWIALPKKPFPFIDPTVDYTVPPSAAGDATSGNTGSMNFGSPAFQAGQFGTNTGFDQNFGTKPGGASLTAIIIGVVLILIGGTILLNNLNIIPYWDIEHLWPVIPITVGLILMLSGNSKKNIPEAQWQQTASAKSDEPASEATSAGDNEEPKA